MIGQPKKVLIDEDNQAVADVIGFNLTRAGIESVITNNGREGLERVNSESFDLIVSDFRMPKMNGEEFCRQLRQDSRFYSLPVIMLSAKGLELDSKTLKEDLGILDIVFKPFSPRELVKTIQYHLDHAPTEAE